MSVILWKIIIVSIFLVQTMIGAFLGWRVLGLMERVKQVQADRDKALEQMGEAIDDAWKLSNKLRLKGIEMDEIKKKMCSDILFRTITDGEKFIGELLSDLEKKLILNALCMPGYNSEMNEPKTLHHVRKTYRDLKEKIKVSFSD